MSNGFNNRPSVGQSILDNAAGNLSGIFSARPTAKYSAGARTTLKINGKLVGFAFAVSWRINTIYSEINTIDDPLPNELIPQRLTVEGTISALHIPGTSAGSENWQSDVLSFLFNQYIQIEVRDVSDNLLFFTNKAVIVSRTEDIRVDQLANVTLQFKAIGFRDEKSPAYPDGISEASPNSGSQLKNSITSRLTEAISDPVGSVKKLIG